MLMDRLSNLSLVLAVLFSFIVIAIFVSFYSTMNSGKSDVATERDLSNKRAIHNLSVLNGS